MKIAVDTGPLSGGDIVRGMGMMTKQLIGQLEQLAKKDKDLRITKLDAFSSDLEKYDLVHFTNFKPFFLSLPKNKRTKTVITIPDLIPLIYPTHYPPGMKGSLRLRENIRRLKNVDAVITISETSKKDIVRFLGIPAEKVHVVYLAAKKVFSPITNRLKLNTVQKQYGLPHVFVLYVGDINYNKNIPNLLKACKVINLPLVICGKNAAEVENNTSSLKTIKGPRDWVRYVMGQEHPEVKHYKELALMFAENNVIRTGFVTDEELAAIYNLASVYIQPSYYEGFGLIILDAMASGVPVVVSKTQALVEVAGDAALVADPNNPDDMAKNINKVLKNKKIKNDLINKGFARVKEFSWGKCAKETLDVYKQVVNSKQ